MKRLSIFENSCTREAKEHYIYYFYDGEYFIITRDSKDGYRENKTELMPNIQAVIDFIVNLINDGNKVDIESGNDYDEDTEILDTSVITDLDSVTYEIMHDLDELIDYCKK